MAYKSLLTDAKTVAGAITVGITATRVLTYNTDRRMALIVNNSANDIYVGFNQSVVANSGIRINALGGSLSFGLFTDFPWLGEIWAIAAGADNSLTYVEV